MVSVVLPIPLDGHPERLEVEAEVLDHVVGAGVSDDADAVVPGCCHERVLGDGVTAFGQDDRLAGADLSIDLGVVETRNSGDVEAKRTQGLEVGLHGPVAEVTSPDVGQAELIELVQQRPEEHDHRAGSTGSFEVHGREIEVGRGSDLEVVALRKPSGLDADAGQDLEDAVDLFDAGEVAQGGAPVVEQRGAQQCDGGILAGLDIDRP